MILMKLMHFMALAKAEKTRITAFLLAFLMTVTMVPTSAFAVDEVPTEEMQSETVTVCETCGSDPCTCESTGEAGEGESEEQPAEPTVCETCGNDPCTCELTGEAGEGEEPVEEDIWDIVDDYEDICLIGFLNKDIEELVFFSDGGEKYVVSTADCPDYLILNTRYLHAETGEPVFYQADTFDADFYDAILGYAHFVETAYFTDVVPAAGLYAKLSSDESIVLYRDLAVATDAVSVDPALLAGEYVVQDFRYDITEVANWHIQLTPDETWPESAAEYLWVNADCLANLSLVPTRVKCVICGKYDCVTEHVRCPACGDFDCPIEHVQCPICGEYDCDVEHVFCENCGDYDCGLNHGYCDLCDKEDCGIKHVLCPICGNYDCPIEHVQCEICGKYDCTVEHVQCEICGEYDCTIEHVQCPVCGEYDCILKHAYCGVCGEMDCTAQHIYCSVCKDFDCGLEHEPEPGEDPYVLPTAPVIPENPELPAEYDVAILDAAGTLVTTEDGFRLGWQDKASLSAWSALGEDVSYQWQILCGDEEADWVDIADQTGKGLLFSRSMIMSVLDDENKVWFRCVTANSSETVTSEPICITLDEAGGAETPAVLAEESPTLFGRIVSYVASLLSVGSKEESGDLAESHSSAVALLADEPDPQDGEGGGSTEYTTITVKYMSAESFETDGEQSTVSAAYVASIERGIPFNQTIVSPTITGFAPFWDIDGDGKIWTGEDYYYNYKIDDDNFAVPDPLPSLAKDYESADEITLTLTAEQTKEDHVYYVYYLPIEVNIGVRYYFQNLDNDNYTEKVERYHSGKKRTGSTVSEEYLTEHAGDTAGYTRMYHQPETVAADGSTVFKCYYDRSYYLIQFELDGGYGAEPVYARYEAPLMTGTPTLAGYEFKGWDLLTKDTNGDGILDAGDGTADPLPDTIPAENRKYKAIWEPIDNIPFTVAYWVDGELIGGEVHTTTAGAPVKGEDYPLTDSTNICGLEEHTHDAACEKITCGKVEHTHSIGCRYNESAYLEYVSASSGTAAGDGSTVVNVYYAHKEYTLRFYYGRTSTANGAEVVGGSTWPFAGHDHYHETNANTSVKTLMGYVSQWGKVIKNASQADDDLSDVDVVFNEEGQKRVKDLIDGQPNPDKVYTLGTDDELSSTYTYYYLEFTAAYGDSLENLWPVGIFNNLTVDETHNHTNCTGQACFSAWNGEYKVKYSQEQGNKTIKGLYMYLDEDLLFAGSWNNDSYYKADEDSPRLVNYLAFWEDGYDISWSVPLLYRYQLWVEPVADAPVDADDVTYAEYMAGLDKTVPNPDKAYADYILYNSFDVYDNSGVGDQTDSAITGYTYLDYYTNHTIKSDMPDGFTSGTAVNFFYERNANYTLTVNNVGEKLGAVENVAFEMKLSTLMDGLKDSNGNPLFTDSSYTPPYPNSLEDDGYVFAGWSTFPTWVEGVPMIDISTYTMPASNLAIYALWKPVEHKVTFFHHYEYLQAYEKGEYTIWYDTDGDGELEEIDFKTGDYGMKTVTVDFGKTVDPAQVPDVEEVGHQLDPNNNNMTFVNWFYTDTDGSNKAYDPATIPIKRNLKVYAEWRDGTAQPYQLNYVVKGHPEHPVAESTLGYSDRGVLRTFSAKAGNPHNELYDLTGWPDAKVRELYGLDESVDLKDYKKNYNEGFFPLTSSHSFVVQEERREDWYTPQINRYNFEYVEATDVSYTVRYVYKATGADIIAPEVKTTSKAVETERFKEFEGFVADAVYKELVIAVVEDPDTGEYVGAPSNVIIFYYTPSGDGLYAIHHMVEKLHADDVYDNLAELQELQKNYAIDGSGGYVEYGKPIQLRAELGAHVDITPIKISGYDLITTNGVARYTVGTNTSTTPLNAVGGKYTIEVTAEGTELYLFYKRQTYDYTVHYYKFNTEDLVDPINLPSKTVKDNPYNSIVTEEAKKFTADKGYKLVSEQKQTLPIREKEDQNVIIFYYSPIQYEINYHMDPPVGGTLTLSKEVDSGTTPFTGSTATANENYKFVGWYTDASCADEFEVKVGVTADTYTKSDTTGVLIPKRLVDVNDDPITNYKFYAKFELLAADFTINRNGRIPGQVFVYRVENEAGTLSIDVTVVVGPNGSGSTTIADLPFGTYTVTQQDSWSWRYRNPTVNNSVTVKHNASSVVDTATPVLYDAPAVIMRWLTGIGDFIRKRYGGA